MFSALDDKERDIVIKAMEEKLFKYNLFINFQIIKNKIFIVIVSFNIIYLYYLNYINI
jgi:hypothetical protein